MLGLKLNHVNKRGPLVTITGMDVLSHHFTVTKAGLLSILSIRTYFIEFGIVLRIWIPKYCLFGPQYINDNKQQLVNILDIPLRYIITVVYHNVFAVWQIYLLLLHDMGRSPSANWAITSNSTGRILVVSNVINTWWGACEIIITWHDSRHPTSE